MFDSPEKLVLGLVTGIVFGFLLQKGRVAKYATIVEQFRFRDWTVVKTMGTAVVVGSLGVYALVDMGQASLHIRPLLLSGVLVGAVCFGVGMGLLGYCPGTCVAACGEGSRDAMVGVVGMAFGASVFVALYSQIRPFMESMGDQGKLTFPAMTSSSPWLWVSGLVVAGSVALLMTRCIKPSCHLNTKVHQAPSA
jgi:uncharacterized protein